jgi:hypothetical protein
MTRPFKECPVAPFWNHRGIENGPTALVQALPREIVIDREFFLSFQAPKTGSSTKWT